MFYVVADKPGDIHRITIIVRSIPHSTPKGDAIYVSGDFNGWFPDVAEHKLKALPDGSYFVIITTHKRKFEYKFTRGTWNKSECINELKFTNRFIDLTLDPSTTVYIDILNWEDKLHTASKFVKVLNDKFSIPQLNRERRIWIYLPPDYEEIPNKHYPVVYMQDGQNLFDNFYSYNIEWQIDKTLNFLHTSGLRVPIVVGTEHGGELRQNEYLPWKYKEIYGGEGDKYASFLAETLKPYIDKNYRTLVDRDQNAIIGGDLGGLISLYTGMKYQHLFSKIACFSAPFHNNPEIFEYVEKMGKRKELKFYFLAGLKEDDSKMKISGNSRICEILKIEGFTQENIRSVVKYEGEQSELFWRREFQQAYRWLFL